MIGVPSILKLIRVLEVIGVPSILKYIPQPYLLFSHHTDLHSYETHMNEDRCDERIKGRVEEPKFSECR